MGSFTFKIRGAEEATAEVQAAIAAGSRNGLEKAGTRGQQLVTDNIITPFGAKPAAVGLGILAGSIFVDFAGGRNLLRAVVAAGPPADVYAAAVETGTRPHFPPASALVPWVMQKFGVSGDDAIHIAFAVARKIAKKGTQGHFMFERAFQQLQGEALGIFEVEIAKEIEARGLAPKGTA